jgi:hypothetical protein
MNSICSPKLPGGTACWLSDLTVQTVISMTGCSGQSVVALHQWLIYPEEMPLMRRDAARLPTYRLLIEANDGRIWFLAVDQRLPPDRDRVEKMAAILVTAASEDIAPSMIEARLCDEAQVVAHVLDDDIERLQHWEIESIAANAFLDKISMSADMDIPQLKGMQQEIKQKTEQDLSSRLARFVAALYADAVAITRSNGGLWPSAYNYLIGDDAITRRNRQQAVVIFPLLLSRLPLDRDYARIREAIDRGTPLFDMLAEHYGAPKSAVKFLAKAPLSQIDKDWHGKVGVLVRLMADIPPEFRPRTHSEWERFFRTIEVISRVSRCPISTTANRLWLLACALRRFDLPDGKQPDLDDAARVIDDLMTGLREALHWELLDIAHATALEPAISVATTHMKASLGIEKLTQVGRRWRDAYRREQQAFLQERDMVLGLRWASPLQEPTPFHGRIVVPLCTPKDLIQEAARMNHCVDTYAGSCMRGDSQIWSLRAEDGSIMSTLETRIVRDKQGGFLVKVIEHRSASNARPGYECIAAVEALLKHLRQSDSALENYWRWKMTTARLTSDKRAMVALTRPIIAALKSTLPKRISFDKLAGMGRDYALRMASQVSAGEAMHGKPDAGASCKTS